MGYGWKSRPWCCELVNARTSCPEPASLVWFWALTAGVIGLAAFLPKKGAR